MSASHFNIGRIQGEIESLQKTLKLTGFIYNKNSNVDTTPFQIQCPELYNASKTLFHFILSEFNKQTHGQLEAFNKRITTLLTLTDRVQKNQVTQESASETVGVILANDFIPENLRKREHVSI